MKPTILISNDDGVDAKGIRHLVELALPFGDVTVVAPDGARSAFSSALTTTRPLKIKERPAIGDARVYAVDGTPADCVKLAMHTVFKSGRPTLMLSGINHGTNAATCVTYSGTMGAAIEACMIGIPAIGFSLLNFDKDADFSPCDTVVPRVIKAVLEQGLPSGVCLNVNVPDTADVKGIKVTRAAHGYWDEEFVDYTSPAGEPFYWMTGRFVNTEPDAPDTDEYWLNRGWGTVVPVSVDMTSLGSLAVIDPFDS